MVWTIRYFRVEIATSAGFLPDRGRHGRFFAVLAARACYVTLVSALLTMIRLSVLSECKRYCLCRRAVAQPCGRAGLMRRQPHIAGAA